MLGSNSAGNSAANTVTGVPDPAGARPGDPRPWSPFTVIW